MKEGWKIWRFEEMAYEVKERTQNPSESGYDRYVGLKHLDTESLKIWRWGSTSDVEKQKLLFKSGDIIFGRRNAYLRRVAVADFDGVCSAHAMVLRAHEDIVLAGFLPFFMQTDLFWEAALKVSAGSMSPTINWSNLAKQEFALPPLDEQRRIGRVLQCSWKCVTGLQELDETILKYEQSYTNSLIGELSCEYKSVSLGNLLICSPESGSSAPPRDNATGHWVLSLGALTPAGYQRGEIKPVDKTIEMKKALLQENDVLISRSNTRERVGFIGIYDGEKIGNISFPDTMMRLSPDQLQISNRYLEMVFQSTLFRRKIMSIAAGTSASMKKINRQTLLKLTLPVPPLYIQQQLVTKKTYLTQHRHHIRDRLNQAKGLHKTLLDSIVRKA